MKTYWCPDCGDVYDSAASHFCAPHVSTETEEQTQPPQTGAGAYVHIPLAEYDALRARVEATERDAERELAQARTEGEAAGLARALHVLEALAEASEAQARFAPLGGKNSDLDQFQAQVLRAAAKSIQLALGGAQ